MFRFSSAKNEQGEKQQNGVGGKHHRPSSSSSGGSTGGGGGGGGGKRQRGRNFFVGSPLQSLFVFVTTACLANYGHLTYHQQKRDMESLTRLTQAEEQAGGAPFTSSEGRRASSSSLDKNRQLLKFIQDSAKRASTTTTADSKSSAGSGSPIFQFLQRHKKAMMKHVQNEQEEAIPTFGKVDPNLQLLNYSAYADYGPTRIPGYIQVENGTHGNMETLVLYGHVMRELMQRICARQIAQSNIVVVTPGAPKVLDLLKQQQQSPSQAQQYEEETTLRKQIHHQVGGCTLLHAHYQGHSYHGFPPQTKLDQAFTSTRNVNKPPPSWILLAMFDSQWDNDSSVSNALQLLQQSTVTYIVVGMGANPQTGEIYGKNAILQLLQLKYKVQVLSQSHLALSPNYDITTTNIDIIFNSIVAAAKQSRSPFHGYIFATQGLDLAIPTAMAYAPTITTTHQGIQYKTCPSTDLEIQFKNPLAFLAKKAYSTKSGATTTSSKFQQYKVMCQGQRIKIPKNGTTDTTVWMSSPNNIMEESEAVCVKTWCNGQPNKAACTTRILPKQDKPPITATTEEPDQKEKQQKPNLLLLMIDPISRARFERSLLKTNRLLQMLNFTTFQQYTAVGNNSGPNQAALYSGMPLGASGRDSISTHHTKTQWLWDTLREKGGYATFKAEDGCVENSNMIQSIKPRVDHGDALLQMMCFDFQRPNCIGEIPASTHLIQYTKQFIEAYQTSEANRRPWAAMMHFIDSHEDTQMLEGTLDEPIFRFLFDFYQIQHCSTSASANSADDKEEDERQQQETKNCEKVSDNTMVVVLSDHGLHYGSYLLSPPGLKERSQPMLHLHLPKTLTDDDPATLEALKTNQHLHTTPFDVYETILDVLIPEERRQQQQSDEEERVGSSLLKPLPENRKNCDTTKGIPSYVCNILEQDHTNNNILMPSPPSMMSFYADIPPTNKVTRPICNAKADNSTIFTNPNVQCLCATSRIKWHYCDQHPWTNGPTPITLGETFAMIDCEDSLSFEIRVQRNPKIVKRATEKLAATATAATKGNSRRLEEQSSSTKQQRQQQQQKPNILFMEVDSVSTAYADRHLPKTRELLSRLRLKRISSDDDDGEGGFTCQQEDSGDAADRLCSVEFQHMSVVGPSSIPNQVAVFGACMVTVGPEQCEQLETDAQTKRTICTNTTHPVFGMELINRLRTSATFCPVDSSNRSPWIFDIAKKAGYVTLFGEEFCYEQSIFVPQGNIFPLEVDIEPGTFFCQATRLRIRRELDMKTGGKPIWVHQYKPGSGAPNCVHKDGGYDAAMVNLDHVTTMWDAYPDIPKFAYVNAIAAHEYADFQVMAEKSETYDLILSSFLKQMLAREDANNTIIIVRSDHGLQAGPVTPDYSIQVEAFRPWTEMIVPKNLGGHSLETLFSNQRRLVTGFDFYKTLTTTIVGSEEDTKGSNSIMPEPPSWTRHLWKDEVEASRNCVDARVSNDYCIFEGQRTFPSPNIRSCNLVEEDQQLVCPAMKDEFTKSMTEIVANSFYTTTKLRPKICPRRQHLQPSSSNATETTTISPNLISMWERLDKASQERKKDPAPDQKSEPLAPRQTAMLTSIVADLANYIYKTENRSLNVCQTGFGQGHSAALFLDASPHVFLHTFSRLNHTTQTPLLYKLQAMNREGRGSFTKRMKHHKCDSCLSMLDYENKNHGFKCDFLHGLQPTAGAYPTPIKDMVKRAPCGTLLSSVATKTLRDSSTGVYFGEEGKNQWAELRDKGCIEDIHCFTEDWYTSNNSATNATATAATTKQQPLVTIPSKFCMAITTGKCPATASFASSAESSSTSSCTASTGITAATRRIVLSQICPSHEVKVPPPPPPVGPLALLSRKKKQASVQV